MASKITYFAALESAISFLKANDFDPEVVERLETLKAQKATKTNTGTKSKARVENERLAHQLIDAMRAENVTEIRAAWVREHLEGVNTAPKAVAVLNAATDLNLLTKSVVAKTPTRNEFVFTLTESE